MNKRNLCRMLIVLVTNVAIFRSTLFAQVTGDNSMLYNKSAPASNNNLFLNAMPDLNVDLYSGKLQAGLPLFTLASSDMNIPVSLSYGGGAGIKLTDQNTTVGLGWTISGGGSVSRM